MTIQQNELNYNDLNQFNFFPIFFYFLPDNSRQKRCANQEVLVLVFHFLYNDSRLGSVYHGQD
jgi:hypothetical protein